MSKSEKGPDYRVFFILGFPLMALGIIYMDMIIGLGLSFIGIGISFLAIGLANKSKWK